MVSAEINLANASICSAGAAVDKLHGRSCMAVAAADAMYLCIAGTARYNSTRFVIYNSQQPPDFAGF
jgi:hypothetical protein